MLARSLGAGIAFLLITPFATNAQVIRQLTDFKSGLTSAAGFDDAGTWAFAISASDPLGSNPAHEYQLFAWNLTSDEVRQITAFDGGIEPVRSIYAIFEPARATVSDDGLRTVFVSRGDLTGQNADGSQEIFAINVDGTGLLQLTDTSLRAGRYGHYQLSGDGSRVVFSSTIDYFGTNPDRDPRVYTVGTDGGSFTEIGTALAFSPSISDDGERIVYFDFFEDPGSVMAVDADGGSARKLVYGLNPVISGDGSTVVVRFGETQTITPDQPYGACYGGQAVAIDWDGTGFRKISCHYIGATSGGYIQSPDIVDDGSRSVYPAFGFDDDASGEVDVNWEIWAARRDASERTQLTNADLESSPSMDCQQASVSGSGNVIGVTCEGGSLIEGSNPDGSRQLYKLNPDGTGVRQLSSGRQGGSVSPVLSGDGDRAVFISSASSLGEPGTVGTQVYLWSSSGETIERLTDTSDFDPFHRPVEAVLSADGSTIAFTVGVNDYAYQLFVMRSDGTELNLIYTGTELNNLDITADGSGIVFGSGSGFWVSRVSADGSGLLALGFGGPPRIAADGSWIVARTSGNVWRVRQDGTGAEQISTSVGALPDISGDGQRIVYRASDEILLYDDSEETTTVLTDGWPGSVANAPMSISDDGSVVYFQSGSVDFYSHWGDPYELFRVATTTGQVERVGSSLPCPVRGRLSVSAVADRVLFSAGRGCTGENPDGEPELFLIDHNALPVLRVDGDPTVVSWTTVAGPTDYDVIRGDLHQIDDPGASSIDLGDVVCIKSASPAYDTIGYEDEDVPAPGRAYFYLFRGSPTIDGSPAAYGQASDGRDRFADAGDCPLIY